MKKYVLQEVWVILGARRLQLDAQLPYAVYMGIHLFRPLLTGKIWNVNRDGGETTWKEPDKLCIVLLIRGYF